MPYDPDSHAAQALERVKQTPEFKEAAEGFLKLYLASLEGQAVNRLRDLVWNEHGRPHPFNHRGAYQIAKAEADALIARRATCAPFISGAKS